MAENLRYTFQTQLSNMFPNRSIEQISSVIDMVLNSETNASGAEQYEIMVDLLTGSDDSGSEMEGAVGFNRVYTQSDLDELTQMFPDINKNYLQYLCDQQGSNFSKDQVVEELLKDPNYPKSERDPLDIWEHLKDILPNADPIYLKNNARILVNRPHNDILKFIENAVEKNDYPTMQEYLKKMNKRKEIDKFTDDGFSIESFIENIPEPFEFYQNTERQHSLSSENVNKTDLEFAYNFLYNYFKYLRQRDIDKVFSNYKYDLIKTFERLKRQQKAFLKPRPFIQLTIDTENIALLQEIAFLKHQNEIKHFIKMKKAHYRIAAEEANLYGLWETCISCYDDKLLPEECFFCNKNCVFCKDCVKTSIETIISKGEYKFKCFYCDSSFSLFTIKMVLDENTFNCIFKKIQMEEIKEANIEGLETCPFCDFSMIPLKNDLLFKCGNIECMKESCRLCRHESHIPLKCNEIEFDEDVKMRTFIENKMTESLLKQCWQCKKLILKESGCNKMTCLCGARMCYVCGSAVYDYSHFNKGSCPLYTENLEEFHRNRVIQGAREAKQQLELDKYPEKLKFDPTRDL